MTEVFVVVVLVWMSALTVAVLGLTRHLAAVQATGAASSAPDGGALLDTDGPFIPSPLPDRTVAAFRAHGIGTDDLIATFFSSRCGTCFEKAEQIVGTKPDPARNVFLVSGSDPDLLRDLLRILDPSGVPVIGDPDAPNIVKSLDIMSTPFAFRVVDEQVVAKAFVRSAADYVRVTGDPPRAPLPIVLPGEGGSQVLADR
jgi:hypothetical protein